jgi:hypothetical protein
LRLAKLLESEGLLRDGGKAVRVYSSDMRRAAETAEIIYDAILQKVPPLAIQCDGDVAPSPEECKPLEEFSSTNSCIPFIKDSLLREGAPCIPEGNAG